MTIMDIIKKEVFFDSWTSRDATNVYVREIAIVDILPSRDLFCLEPFINTSWIIKQKHSIQSACETVNRR